MTTGRSLRASSGRILVRYGKPVLSSALANGDREELKAEVRRAILAGMLGKQSRRPQLVRVAQLLGLPAGQRRKPSARLCGDLRILAPSRAVVERVRDDSAGPRVGDVEAIVVLAPGRAAVRVRDVPRPVQVGDLEVAGTEEVHRDLRFSTVPKTGRKAQRNTTSRKSALNVVRRYTKIRKVCSCAV